MNPARPRVSELTPEELELLALSHVESMFLEVRSACAVVREEYHPVKLAKRHPVATVLLAAAAGFLVVYALRSRGGGGRREGTGNGLLASFFAGLAGAAGRALPGLAAAWLTRRNPPDTAGPGA